MRVRDAAPNDGPAIARIRREALRERAADAYTDDQLDSLASPDAEPRLDESFLEREAFTSVVATENGDPVGYGAVHPEDGQIHAVFVAPERAESGIGRRILTELETRARDAGTDELFALSTPNAVEFYERQSYRTVREETTTRSPRCRSSG